MEKKIKKHLFAAVLTLFTVFAAAPYAAATGRELVPMGNTVGIQMNTDGVVVVGFAEPEDLGGESPAEAAGIKAGDVIVSVGEKSTKTGTEFLTAVSMLDGSAVELGVMRAGELIRFSVSPKAAPDGAWQLGIWLRDSVSGIGTVTFYCPETGIYGALGHPISDSDTGIIMPIGEGAIMYSTVVDVKAGAIGAPGELCGYFEIERKLGDVSINTECGIFGNLNDCDRTDAIPAAAASEIRLGKASILSNVRGTDVEEFEVEITRIYRGEERGRSMMITVTDPELLKITGGIVQGMSGSPVIQDGKLIGAVTHVLINDPARGYGVSIEEMLKAADSLSMPSAA